MDTLGSFPLLAGMNEEQQKRYSTRCIWRTYEAGETIIDHHETSTELRFIASGTVRVVVRMVEGREVIFNDHSAGDFFGELAAIDGGPRSASVSALVRSRVCIMPQNVFKEIVEDVPEVGWRTMNHLVGHVRRLSDRLSEYSFLKAKHRLYAELLRLSKERVQGMGNGGDDDTMQRIISPAPLQSDIADRISSRREIVSREMKELERGGIIERSRGGLIITKPATLSNMAAAGWLS
ncbi:MAG: Crp/Fnr family transcriptional regulator [Pseudomonadota bacterium]